jgi:hypothetical protein
MALKLYDTLTPSGNFPLVEAKDVQVEDGKRLPDVIPKLVPVTKGEYEELEAAGKIEPDVYYMIARDEA